MTIEPTKTNLPLNKNRSKNFSLLAVFSVIETHVDAAIDSFSHDHDITAQHSLIEHLHDLMLHIEKHVHLPNLLKLK